VQNAQPGEGEQVGQKEVDYGRQAVELQGLRSEDFQEQRSLPKVRSAELCEEEEDGIANGDWEFNLFDSCNNHLYLSQQALQADSTSWVATRATSGTNQKVAALKDLGTGLHSSRALESGVIRSPKLQNSQKRKQ
jgi:hypothetical protein